MASGVEMMLKAFGIDPAEIQRSMTETITKLQQGITGLDNRLTSIDTRLAKLEKHLGIVSDQAEPDTAILIRKCS